MKGLLSAMIGPVSLTISAPGHASQIIESNLRGPAERQLANPPDLPDLDVRIHEGAGLPKFDAEYSAGKLLQLNRHGLRFQGNGFVAQVTGLFDGQSNCVADISVQAPHMVKNLLQSLTASVRQRRFVAPAGRTKTLQAIMSYSLFWWLLHTILMKKGASFIHASSIERDGQAMLLAGTGGCGKTSTTFRLLEDTRYRYLAEDFSILGIDGRLYYNPKAMSIYASDLRGSPRLLEDYAEAKMSRAEHRFWQKNANGPHNPMHKVSPMEVLPQERLCAEARLGTAVFLSRGRFDRVHLQDIDANDFSTRSMNAAYREMKTLTEILALAAAVGGSELPMPGIEAFRASMKSNFICATRKCDCYLLNIPQHAQPELVAAQLRNLTS